MEVKTVELGNKLYELRKNAKLSQEQLAQKLNVTRQTISNWELNQTTPDILQAKQLSQIFTITIDELANNNTQDILVEKLNKTDKNVSSSMSKIKLLFIITICFLLIFIIINLFLLLKKWSSHTLQEQSTGTYQEYLKNVQTQKLIFNLANNEYEFVIFYDNEFNTIGTHFNLVNGNQNAKDNFDSFTNSLYNPDDNAKKIIEDLKQYFLSHGGTYEEL